MADKIAIEIEVSKRILKLLEDGISLRDYCLGNGAAIPEPLARLLGEEPAVSDGPPRMTIPPMPTADRPVEADASWINVEAAEATVVTLVLACLRRSSHPVSPSNLFSYVASIRPSVNKGSIANMGARLVEEGIIERSESGWLLIAHDRAPMIHKGFLWGRPSTFDKYDVAAYRRNAVKHVLGVVPGGLQVMQLTNALKESCPWFNPEIPVSKDLLKVDMQELEKDRAVRRVGNSGKWELVP